MKKIVILISLTVMLCGCDGNYTWNPDPVALQRAFSDFGRQQTEIWKAQQPQVIYPQQQSNYWQEQRARQEYFSK